MIWKAGIHTFNLEQRGLVMGILNVTPDSFSDGGQFESVKAAIGHAGKMIADGARIIDVGGESTRPGADEVDEATEINRVVPVIRALSDQFGDRCAISIDTMKANVAAQAIEAGASIINDVTGLEGDPAMAEVAARTKAGVVIMHMQGKPRTMQQSPVYHDVVADVRAFFESQYKKATGSGISSACLLFDPGIGFGKTLQHNLTLLKNLFALSVNNRPILLGVSRKSFIGMVLDSKKVADRRWPTVALTSFARELGVRVVRVHDVKENVEALRMTEAILHGTVD